MQRLEVSGAVRPLQWSLGVKSLMSRQEIFNPEELIAGSCLSGCKSQVKHLPCLHEGMPIFLLVSQGTKLEAARPPYFPTCLLPVRICICLYCLDHVQQSRCYGRYSKIIGLCYVYGTVHHLYS